MTKTLHFSCMAAVLALSACAQAPGGPRVTAQLQPTTGNTTTGAINFIQTASFVKVTGEVRGLRPNAEHGFHVHEKGDCSSGDGMSAGGHFNPDNRPHGNPMDAAHHVGDLPSLKADANGVARISFESTRIALGNGVSSIVGKGLIVHLEPDDYATQPTGNSGARMACAVIVQS